MMNDSPRHPEQESKREFLKYILTGGILAWVASVLYPILAYLKPPLQPEVEVSSVKAGKLADIPKESGTIVKFGSKPVILVRSANDELKAFDATCTHLDCTVQYSKEKGLMWCACHNGTYDLTGRNVGGPPPRPLEEYRVTTQGEEVLVSKKS